MIQYKNISYSAKTFYGIEFAPGEIKSVPGFINSSSMVRVFPKKKSNHNKLFDAPEKTETRGRKKKSSDSLKGQPQVAVSVAETQEIQIKSEEETTNGNPS